VKTTNLTPWCNLFSIALKYNIHVKKSCYKLVIITGGLLLLTILLIISFSYAYHLALALAAISFIVASVVVSQANTEQAELAYGFEINQHGICSFDGQEHFQLLSSSRLSFVGCWLTMNSLSALQPTANLKQVFIFRDSLSAQDFSRLSLVMKNLVVDH